MRVIDASVSTVDVSEESLFRWVAEHPRDIRPKLTKNSQTLADQMAKASAEFIAQFDVRRLKKILTAERGDLEWVINQYLAISEDAEAPVSVRLSCLDRIRDLHKLAAATHAAYFDDKMAKAKAGGESDLMSDADFRKGLKIRNV